MAGQRIAIVDYDMGNIGSIANMLRRIGAEGTITADPKVIESASKLILPGVGAFDAGMRKLHERELTEVLRRKVVEEGTPVLGICLGMQLLTRGSDEGSLSGLGWIPAVTRRFKARAEGRPSIRVPHMGWNVVRWTGDSILADGLESEARFYFVHSYYVVSDQDGVVVGQTSHGHSFASVVQSGNIFGTQFHPEKSHRYGLQLLRNFVEST